MDLKEYKGKGPHARVIRKKEKGGKDVTMVSSKIKTHKTNKRHA